MFTNEILSEILPQKSDVQQAKISLHNGDQATVILAAKQPVFFEYSCIYYPTGKHRFALEPVRALELFSLLS